jgi:hypothetical protein
MGQILETFRAIRNHACVVCGADFSVPRAGKLYCSNRCKQFSFYHKAEIRHLHGADRGISDTVIVLKLKDFVEYNKMCDLLAELKSLRKRKDSTFLSFDIAQDRRLLELEKSLPGDLKNLQLRKLTIEKWAFLKAIHSHLKKRSFYSVIGGLDSAFLNSLDLANEVRKGPTRNPLRVLFEKHLEKLIQGRIKFV